MSADTADNDAWFTIEETDAATEVDESGSTDTFTVVLDAQLNQMLFSRSHLMTPVKQPFQ